MAGPWAWGPRALKASHGGNAKHAPLAAHTIAILRRGGRLPHASGDPRERRATRARRRRRRPLVRQRAEGLAHVQHTDSPDNLPESGHKLASTANRQGGAERFAPARVRQTIPVARALRASDAARLNDLALSSGPRAQAPAANPCDRLRSIPGVGKRLALVRRDDSPALTRVPRGPEVAAAARVVTCPRASAGQRLGTAGAKLGHVPLTWAFSEAAGLFLRHHPAAHEAGNALQPQPGTAQALARLAPTLGRAVSVMRTRQAALELQPFCAGGMGRGRLSPPLRHRRRLPLTTGGLISVRRGIW
jgi:hypothetical protein